MRKVTSFIKKVKKILKAISEDADRVEHLERKVELMTEDIINIADVLNDTNEFIAQVFGVVAEADAPAGPKQRAMSLDDSPLATLAKFNSLDDDELVN